jgi:Protein of unknown function (DUF4232)
MTSRHRSTHRSAALLALLALVPAGHLTSSAPRSGSAPPAGSVAAADLVPCQGRQLSAAFTMTRVIRGRHRVVLVLTNASAAPCAMVGFVGLRMLGADGDGLLTDVERGAALRPPSEVVVPPAGQASTLLSWTDVDSAQGCVAPSGIAITPPNDTQVVATTWPVVGLVCEYGRIEAAPVHRGVGPL